MDIIFITVMLAALGLAVTMPIWLGPRFGHQTANCINCGAVIPPNGHDTCSACHAQRRPRKFT